MKVFLYISANGSFVVLIGSKNERGMKFDGLGTPAGMLKLGYYFVVVVGKEREEVPCGEIHLFDRSTSNTRSVLLKMNFGAST